MCHFPAKNVGRAEEGHLQEKMSVSRNMQDSQLLVKKMLDKNKVHLVKNKVTIIMEKVNEIPRQE